MTFSAKQILIAFATGAAAGAAVAYMTTPRTGKDMRAALQSWARDARDKAASLPHALRAGKDAFAESYRDDNGHRTHA